MEKEKEVRLWIKRYEQVMMDLHAAQFQLMQTARGDDKIRHTPTLYLYPLSGTD